MAMKQNNHYQPNVPKRKGEGAQKRRFEIASTHPSNQRMRYEEQKKKNRNPKHSPLKKGCQAKKVDGKRSTHPQDQRALPLPQ